MKETQQSKTRGRDQQRTLRVETSNRLHLHHGTAEVIYGW